MNHIEIANCCQSKGLSASPGDACVIRLVLASTSPHRQALLRRLQLPFTVADPRIDETALPGEASDELAARLAAAKASAALASDAICIGSDQVAALHGEILRKPGNAEKAVEQLLRCQGQTVDFHTAVTVIRGPSQTSAATVDRTRVHFRTLPRSALEKYVAIEEPLSCAGGFKSEGLGIALFERIESSDPTALIGLPMIWLSGVLMAWGLDPFGSVG
jgi:septum formation protein